MTRDHVAIANKYAADVLSGKIPANKKIKRACQRHADDLARKRWRYAFNADKAGRACRFIERLPHTKGEWAAARSLITLEPWQCFIVCSIFGWVDAKTGWRRFRTAYLQIPRKNGKSILAAGIGLYLAFADGEFGAEVYSGATTEKQAWEVFKPAKLMMQRRPEFAKALGVDVRAKVLVCEEDESKFEPIIGDPGDGSSPSCAIVDEFHEHDTPNQYDTMQTGMGSRRQALMLVITTAGYNLAGPCHEKYEECARVLDGVFEDDTLFACIYEADPEDDWTSPSTLRKVNPNFGVSVFEDFLLAQLRAAMQNPIQQAKFKTKHLNQWCNTYAALFNIENYRKCADPALDEGALIDSKARCIFAVDLASKSDFCTQQRIYERDIAGQRHYYAFARYWLPEAKMDEEGPNKAHYAKWHADGWLTRTDGATVDFDLIKDTTVADAKESSPDAMVYDPFNATAFAKDVENEGVLCVEFNQNPQAFAVPLDELANAIDSGRYHHDGNPISLWCFANTVGRPAKKGMFSPVKQKGKDHQKIDGAVAVTMGISFAMGGDIGGDLDGALADPIFSKG